MANAILTAIGPDRPGLVDEVSRFLFERGANIEDTRMVNLHGTFAMTLLIAGAEGVLQRVRTELDQMSSSTGLHAELRPATPGAGKHIEGMPYRLTASGIDQAGVMHHLAHVLCELQVNIESLDTRLAPAPYTGSPMFEMESVLSVPQGTPITQVRHRLGDLFEALNIDWTLTPGPKT